jgi:hypothetical protein
MLAHFARKSSIREKSPSFGKEREAAGLSTPRLTPEPRVSAAASARTPEPGTSTHTPKPASAPPPRIDWP